MEAGTQNTITREGPLDCTTSQATNSHTVSISIDLHSILDLHAINTPPCPPSRSFLNTVKLEGKTSLFNMECDNHDSEPTTKSGL